MKFKIILIIFFSIFNSLKSFNENDTLLIFVSNDYKVNELYSKIIKLKFPEMNIKFLKNKLEFYKYIPENLYKKRIDNFGYNKYSNYSVKRAIDFTNLDLFENFDSIQNAKKEIKIFHFLDISSQYEYIWKDNNLKEGDPIYKIFYHSLNIVSFHNVANSFRQYQIKILDVKSNFFNDKIIPLSEIDESSYNINPVLICLYLKTFFNEGYLTKNLKKSPCDIQYSDTIFICSILSLDNENKKFDFVHTHIKLNNSEFAKIAISKIKNMDSFYFYYFDERYNCYYIIDLLNFEIKYFYLGKKKLNKIKKT